MQPKVSENGTRGANNSASPHSIGAPLDTATGAQTFDFSRFKSKSDNSPKASRLDWRGLCALLEKRRTTSGVAGKDGAAIGGASYPDGATRGNSNVASVSLAILDFDNGTTLEEIEASAAKLNSGDGCAAFVYSTFSHTKDAPKFRVVLPLSAPVSALDWPHVWQRLALAFDGAPDEKAKDAARLHFLPSCPKDAAGDAITREIGGDCLDVATLPQLPQPETSAPDEQPRRPINAQIGATSGDRYAEKAVTNELDRLRTTSSNRNSALNTAALAIGHFVGAGRFNRADAESLLYDASASNGYLAKDGEKQTRDTIKSGLNTGERDPNYTGLPKQPRAATARDASAVPQRQRDEQRPDERAPEENKPARLIPIGELRKRPAPKWLIQRFLVQRATSLFTADSGSYKSFVALHIAYCVAHSMEFFGRGVHGGAVVYVAGEGGDGIRARSMAWDAHHKRDAPANLFVWENAVQIARENDVADFLAEMEASGVQPALIIFDTLNRCAEGLEENSAKDMGLFCAGLERIKRATGAHCGVVHHNNAGGKSRGSTALPGAFETRFSAERDGSIVTLRCQKQKDGAPEFEPFALEAHSIEIGETDEYGDSITSLILEKSDKIPTSEKPDIGRGNSKERTYLAILEKLRELHDKADGAKVSKTEWLEAATPSICNRSTFYLRIKEMEAGGRWHWCFGDCQLLEIAPDEAEETEKSEKSEKSEIGQDRHAETEKSEKSEKSGATVSSRTNRTNRTNPADSEPYKANSPSGDGEREQLEL